MLYLVRHANPQVDSAVAANRWHLSALGRKRAKQLAIQLQACGIQTVISSQEPKAYQTAQILAGHTDLNVEMIDGLHEHKRPWFPGSYTSNDQFFVRVQEFFMYPGRLVLGTETADQCFERFDRTMHQVIDRYQNQTLAVVTHGTVLSLWIARYNSLDAFTFWQQLGMPTCLAIDVPNFILCKTWRLPEPIPA